MGRLAARCRHSSGPVLRLRVMTEGAEASGCPFPPCPPPPAGASGSSSTYGKGHPLPSAGSCSSVRPPNTKEVAGQGRRAPFHVSKGGGSGAARPGGASPDTNSPADCLCLASARGTVPGHGGRGGPAALARWHLASKGGCRLSGRSGPKAVNCRQPSPCRSNANTCDRPLRAPASARDARRTGLPRPRRDAARPEAAAWRSRRVAESHPFGPATAHDCKFRCPIGEMPGAGFGTHRA